MELWGPAPFFAEFASERMMGAIKRAGRKSGVSVEYNATKAYLKQEGVKMHELYNSSNLQENDRLLKSNTYSLEKPDVTHGGINLNLVEIINVLRIVIEYIVTDELTAILHYATTIANTTEDVVTFIARNHVGMTWIHRNIQAYKVFKIPAENYSLKGRGLEYRETSNTYPSRAPIKYGSNTFASQPYNELNRQQKHWYWRNNLNSWCVCNDAKGAAMQINAFFTLQTPNDPVYACVVQNLAFAFATVRKAVLLEAGDNVVRINLQAQETFDETIRVVSIESIITRPTVSIFFDEVLQPIYLSSKPVALDENEKRKRTAVYSSRDPASIIP